MNRHLETDRKRFLKALDEATSPFLKVGEDRQKSIEEFPEPIRAIARWYLVQEMTIEEAAREIGLSDPKILQAHIQANPELQELGLYPLTRGNSIKREVWEDNLSHLLSPFQAAASSLKLGTPFRQR